MRQVRLCTWTESWRGGGVRGSPPLQHLQCELGRKPHGLRHWEAGIKGRGIERAWVRHLASGTGDCMTLDEGLKLSVLQFFPLKACIPLSQAWGGSNESMLTELASGTSI